MALTAVLQSARAALEAAEEARAQRAVEECMDWLGRVLPVTYGGGGVRELRWAMTAMASTVQARLADEGYTVDADMARSLVGAALVAGKHATPEAVNAVLWNMDLPQVFSY
jgi:hypothetical protein